MFKLIILSTLAILSFAGAERGQVVMQKVRSHLSNDADQNYCMMKTFTDLGKEIVQKDRHEWDLMTTDDFKAFDAVLITNHKFTCPSYEDDSLYYDPFSNSEQWGPAVRNGNTIILGSENIVFKQTTETEDWTILHAAASYSLNNTEHTGAFISVDRMYQMCPDLNSTWLDVAFDVQNEEDRFNLTANPFYRGANYIVDEPHHPSLDAITAATVNRDRRASALTVFSNYPPFFTPFAKNNATELPFILLKGEDSSSTSAPSAFAPKDVIDVGYGPSTVVPTIAPTECPNNSTFRLYGEEKKSCTWIGETETRRTEKCTMKVVQKHCPQTCNVPCYTSTPSIVPFPSPTEFPSQVPTLYPTQRPSSSPIAHPSLSPSGSPRSSPTQYPSKSPTVHPTAIPTSTPMRSPSKSPTVNPTSPPTRSPSKSPTMQPTAVPNRASLPETKGQKTKKGKKATKKKVTKKKGKKHSKF